MSFKSLTFSDDVFDRSDRSCEFSLSLLTSALIHEVKQWTACCPCRRKNAEDYNVNNDNKMGIKQTTDNYI